MAAGVIGIKLDKDDEVVACLPVSKMTDNLAIFTANGIGKQTNIKDFPYKEEVEKEQLLINQQIAQV